MADIQVNIDDSQPINVTVHNHNISVSVDDPSISVSIEDAQPISVAVENAQPVSVNMGEAVNQYMLPGLKGDTGDTGPQGIPGPQGEQGPKGEQGDIGPQGPIGLTGPKGEQGIQGVKGDTGAQGIQGEKGDKGDTGDAGPEGPQGLQGVQGETGLQGPAGPAGDDGVVQSIVAGENVTVDSSDPANPIVSSAAVAEQPWEEVGAALRYNKGLVEIIPPNGFGTGPVLRLRTLNSVAEFSTDTSSNLVLSSRLVLSNGLTLAGALILAPGLALDMNGAQLQNIASITTRAASAYIRVSPDFNASQAFANQGIIVVASNRNKGQYPRAAFHSRASGTTEIVAFMASTQGFMWLRNEKPDEPVLTVRNAPAQTAWNVRYEDSNGLPIGGIDQTGAPILVSPNGSKWRLTVNDAGVLTTTAV